MHGKNIDKYQQQKTSKNLIVSNSIFFFNLLKALFDFKRRKLHKIRLNRTKMVHFAAKI